MIVLFSRLILGPLFFPLLAFSDLRYRKATQ
jgi:hypothetical protein